MSKFKWVFIVGMAAFIGATSAHEMLLRSVESTNIDEESGLDDEAPVEEVMPQQPVETVKTPITAKWSPPDYSKQENHLGWTPQAFDVPKGMEDRVKFWQDIYVKYTSEQGVLHDSRYVNIVYDTVDFTDISARQDLNTHQKERERRKRVNEKKKEIAARLKRLQTLKSDEGLEGEDYRYWQMFNGIDEHRKFVDAGTRKRLRFQLGQRDIFIRGIYQSGRYLRQMEEIFRQEGLPLELTRLPFVESSFNLKARSRVGASGIWQFMRSTGRMYLRMDASADERNDPLAATRAAAKKLKDNFNMLQSWPLAITAWNHGPNGVKRLTQKFGTTDIVELIDIRKGRFGFASASFFASFLAALKTEAEAEKYFGPLDVMPELRGADVQLVKSVPAKDIMKWFSDNLDVARELNPHVVDAVWKGRMPLSRKHLLRVPLTIESQARSELE